MAASDQIPKQIFPRIYITFFQSFSRVPFSPRVFRSGSYKYLGAVSRIPSATSPRSCSQPTYDFGRLLAANLKRFPPSLAHYFVLLCFTVLISFVSCQCPATMLSLSSSHTEPGYGLLAVLLAMAGPSESVFMRKFRTPHLLSSQRENPSRVEWLLWLLTPRRNGRLSPDAVYLLYC